MGSIWNTRMDAACPLAGGIALALVVVCAHGHDALAATHGAVRLPVTSCADDGSEGTLRSVVAVATSTQIVDLSGLACSTITLTSGAINTEVDVIRLSGPPDRAITIDGASNDRVIVHRGGKYGALYIDHLTIAGGRYDGQAGYMADGGCVYADNNLNLDTVVVTGCSAGVDGGGAGYGGGIFSRAGILLISSSTIVGNAANKSGGGAFASGDVQIVNSTISGNSSPGGAGIFIAAGLRLRNSTVAFNTSIYGGGGIFIGSQANYVPYIESSIISNNVATPGFYAADIGRPTKAKPIGGSHNIIMSSDELVPPDTRSDDPGMRPLGNNGGPTPTHAIDATSIAADAGSNPDQLAFDQRGPGFARVAGPAADIGAFELQVDAIFEDGFDP